MCLGIPHCDCGMGRLRKSEDWPADIGLSRFIADRLSQPTRGSTWKAYNLSKLTPYEALAIFPLAYLLGFSFNPIEFLWTFHHGFQPMPEEVREKAARVRRYAYFLGDAMILGSVAFLMSKILLPPASVGLHLGDWKRNVVAGILAGAALVLVQRGLTAVVPLDPQHPFTDNSRRGSVLLWMFILLAGAFSEELWIALCLVTLVTSGFSVAIAVAMTVVVFAAVHYPYRLGVIGVFLKGIVSAILFLWSGSLIPSFIYHVTGNLNSLYSARRCGAMSYRRM